MGLGLERDRVLAVLRPGRGLGAVERPLVDAEQGLPGFGHGLRAQFHALGEDDLLLRGQERDPADLPQVQAHGIVRVQDLGRHRLRIGFFRGLGGRCGLDHSRLGNNRGLGDKRLGLEVGCLGVKFDGHRRECRVGVR